MLASLARNKAWSESIDDELRAKVVEKLRGALDIAETARDFARVAQAIGGLERCDIERAKALREAERESDTATADEVAAALCRQMQAARSVTPLGGS